MAHTHEIGNISGVFVTMKIIIYNLYVLIAVYLNLKQFSVLLKIGDKMHNELILPLIK